MRNAEVLPTYATSWVRSHSVAAEIKPTKPNPMARAATMFQSPWRTPWSMVNCMFSGMASANACKASVVRNTAPRVPPRPRKTGRNALSLTVSTAFLFVSTIVGINSKATPVKHSLTVPSGSFLAPTAGSTIRTLLRPTACSTTK